MAEKPKQNEQTAFPGFKNQSQQIQGAPLKRRCHRFYDISRYDSCTGPPISLDPGAPNRRDLLERDTNHSLQRKGLSLEGSAAMAMCRGLSQYGGLFVHGQEAKMATEFCICGILPKGTMNFSQNAVFIVKSSANTALRKHGFSIGN